MRIARGTMICLLLLPPLLRAAASERHASIPDRESHQVVAEAISDSLTVPTSMLSRATTASSATDRSRNASTIFSPASNYTITWASINGGGITRASSTSYSMGGSAGQSAAGSSRSATYQMGIGFWYGVGGCYCPRQGDINADTVIDVFDVIGVIDIAFSGGTDQQDPLCPATRADVDNNGVTDVFDVIYLIATAFSGGPNPIDPCGP